MSRARDTGSPHQSDRPVPSLAAVVDYLEQPNRSFIDLEPFAKCRDRHGPCCFMIAACGHDDGRSQGSQRRAADSRLTRPSRRGRQRFLQDLSTWDECTICDRTCTDDRSASVRVAPNKSFRAISMVNFQTQRSLRKIRASTKGPLPILVSYPVRPAVAAILLRESRPRFGRPAGRARALGQDRRTLFPASRPARD